MEQFLAVADPQQAKYFWIGLTDVFSEGDFIWLPSGAKPTYFNWHGIDPTGGENEDFVMIYQERKWADQINNGSLPVFALCEKEY